MQIVLCLIFGGSIALAQWVVHDRQVNGSTRLSGMIPVGPIEVRPPEGWSVTKTQDPNYLEAREPGNGEQLKTLEITARKVSPDMKPEGYLLMKGLYHFGVSVPISIGNARGILMSNRPGDEMLPAAGPIDDELIAACVTSNGIAVSIVLSCPDETPDDRPANVQLIRDIARRIQVRTEPGRQ